MRALEIEVLSVQPQPDVAAFGFHLRVQLADAGEPVHSVRLRAEVHLQTARRRYRRGEQAALEDLFGTSERWGTTLRPLYWTSVRMQLPPFERTLEIVLSVPFPEDANAAATRYFHALQQGEIPVELLFSGTIFYHAGRDESGDEIQVAFIPWSLDAACSIPEAVWMEVRRRVQTRQKGRPLILRAGLSWDQLLNDVLEAGKEQPS